MRNTIMRDTIDFISDKLNGLSKAKRFKQKR